MSTRAGRDLVALKLEQRLLKEQLSVNAQKTKALGNVLDKKRATGCSRQFDSIAVVDGSITLKDLRLPTHKIKVPVRELMEKPKRTHEDIDPSPIVLGSRLHGIRSAHMLRTAGKNELKRREQLEKHRQEKEEAKKRRGQRTVFPKISVPASMFPARYDRGELPSTIEHGIKGWYLSWVCPLDKLDYEYYLPIYFDGLQCGANPSCFLARQGIEDLLYAAKGETDKISPCIAGCIRPIRNALSKFNAEILLGTLKAIQQLVNSAPGIGAVLMPHSKQFLAPLAAFLDMNRNIGDQIDYGQRNENDIGEQVLKTLELLEEKGGPGALRSIKFSIPLYESCMKG